MTQVKKELVENVISEIEKCIQNYQNNLYINCTGAINDLGLEASCKIHVLDLIEELKSNVISKYGIVSSAEVPIILTTLDCNIIEHVITYAQIENKSCNITAFRNRIKKDNPKCNLSYCLQLIMAVEKYEEIIR